MLSFLLGAIGKFLVWTAELVVGAVIEGFLFGQEVITIATSKKKKKKPAMTKKVKSPTKKQRKKMSQSSGGTSSQDYLSPGAKGTIINSGGPK